MRQSEEFHEAIGGNAVIMAKFDSSPKEDTTISRVLDLLLTYPGEGEQLVDLVVFNPNPYLDELPPMGYIQNDDRNT